MIHRNMETNDKRHILQERKDSRNSNQLSKNQVDSKSKIYQHDSEGQQWIFIKVHLKKGRKGYGLAFINDKSPNRQDDEISITKIVHEGVAQQDGRLKVGDIIVSVNDVDFDEVSYEEAISSLRNTGPNMTMTVRRLREYYYESDENSSQQCLPPINTYESDEATEYESDNEQFQQLEVKLMKRSVGGLGINVQGGFLDENENEEDNYITISKLAVNSVAANDGRLQVGDIILQVDYQSFDGITHYDAVETLKNTGKEVTLYIGRYIQKNNRNIAKKR